ncbi:protein SAMBA [Malus sylvestris]|uniref:protein SAMBA n=1 Tax=Malus sylvestris TaxID=3752 RepID=UPI0021ABE172|nr:protein SAMBA [Malus sylvestris]
MSNSNSSPAHSSISTTAIAGERERSNSNPAAAAALSDDLFFPSDLISIQDRKQEALLVIKSDLMDALNKVVKSLEEDNWMFEGSRHRVIPISRQGGFLQKHKEASNKWNMAPPK